MRRVAGFQALRVDGTPDIYRTVSGIISSWVADKFSEVDGITVVRRSRRPAQSDLAEERLGDRVRLRLDTLEEAEGGSGLEFRTSTRVLLAYGRLYVRSEVLLGQGQDVLGGHRGTARAPRFFRQILTMPGHWHFDEGADRFLSQVLVLRGKDLDVLEQVLTDERRRLPMVLVSAENGQEHFDGLAASLARATVGLAHVALLNDDASWGLTQRFGPKWSCYGQAVRVFWPRRFGEGSPYDHPLHLASRMPDTCAQAVDRIVLPLIEGSSLLGGYPVLDRFEADLARARFDEALAPVRVTQDFQALAEAYDQENDRLRAETEVLRAERDDLRRQLEDARTAQVIGLVQGSQPDDDLMTVVADFQNKHGDVLTFSDHIADQISTINPQGFSPADLGRSLDLLIKMASVLRDTNGALGVQTSLWCRARGVDCSGESETKKGSGLRRFRVEGRDEEFDLHLKPTDRRAPDRCIRIYFKPSPDHLKVVVGYVGSKRGLE